MGQYLVMPMIALLIGELVLAQVSRVPSHQSVED